MKKTILLIMLITISSFALTLEDVKKGLSVNRIHPDSLEYRLRLSVTAPMIGTQSTDYHYVSKGKNKVYFEIRGSMMNQRMVLSGSKMKTIDLVTMKEKISEYNGEIKKLSSSLSVNNPLDKGEWRTPVQVDGNTYKIEGDSSTIYYDASKKHLQKMEQSLKEGSSVITFEYDDATNQISRMLVSVLVDGVETKMDMFFSVFCSSKNFPDRYFKF